MEISKEQAEKIQNHIMSLLGKEVSFVDTENRYIASSYPNNVGRKANLSTNIFTESQPKELEIRGEEQIVIPIIYEGKSLGVLLVNNDDNNGLEQAKIIKSFTELLMQQTIEKTRALKDSTDQFISKMLFENDPKKIPYLISEASILGHKLNISRIAIFIKIEGFWENCLLNDYRFEGDRTRVIEHWKKEIENAISGFFTKASDNIIAYLGEDYFIIFKDISNSDEDKAIELINKNFSEIFNPLKNHQTKKITVGISKAYIGIKGLIKAYNESKMTALLGEKIYGGDKSYFIDDLGIVSIIGDGAREKN